MQNKIVALTTSVQRLRNARRRRKRNDKRALQTCEHIGNPLPDSTQLLSLKKEYRGLTINVCGSLAIIWMTLSGIDRAVLELDVRRQLSERVSSVILHQSESLLHTERL